MHGCTMTFRVVELNMQRFRMLCSHVVQFKGSCLLTLTDLSALFSEIAILTFQIYSLFVLGFL